MTVHYRVTGPVRFHSAGHVLGVRGGGPALLRSAVDDGRRLWKGTLLTFRRPYQIWAGDDDLGLRVEYDEWWQEDAIALSDRPLLMSGHGLLGGHRVGQAVGMLHRAGRLQAIFELDRGAVGDAAAELLDAVPGIGLSIGFNSGRFEVHKGMWRLGLSRTGASLFEVAITPTPAYDDARMDGPVLSADLLDEARRQEVDQRTRRAAAVADQLAELDRLAVASW